METFGTFLSIVPAVAFGAAFLLALATFSSRYLPRMVPRVPYLVLVKCTAAFYVAYAALLTLGQYLLWRGDQLGGHFLNTPLDPSLPIPLVKLFPGVFQSGIGYFLIYSWGRFWLHVICSVGTALCVWWFLRALRRRNERFFEKGETELGFLLALIVGWPNALVFLFITFLCVVLLSAVRLAFFKEQLTTFGLPFIIAAAVTLLFGNALAALIGVSVLKA